MATGEREIDHPTQLNALSVFPLLRTRTVGRLRLGGSLAGHPERAAWEAELNRQYFACGCDTSAKGLLLGLLGGGLVGLFAAESPGAGLGLALGGALAGAVLGKALGLLRAHSRLRDVVRKIQKSWKVEPPADPIDAWTCG
ncbi:MAG: hypothetical protein R2991_07985 [Thermoanaerobaculia bacterium]